MTPPLCPSASRRPRSSCRWRSRLNGRVEMSKWLGGPHRLCLLLAIVAVSLLVGCSNNPPTNPDRTLPDPVRDLRASGASSVSDTLRWTAPGDVDSAGVALAYDIR